MARQGIRLPLPLRLLGCLVLVGRVLLPRALRPKGASGHRVSLTARHPLLWEPNRLALFVGLASSASPRNRPFLSRNRSVLDNLPFLSLLGNQRLPLLRPRRSSEVNLLVTQRFPLLTLRWWRLLLPPLLCHLFSRNQFLPLRQWPWMSLLGNQRLLSHCQPMRNSWSLPRGPWVSPPGPHLLLLLPLSLRRPNLLLGN